MNNTQTLRFSINNWGHLYSLQQAITHNEQHTGRTLSINGTLLNQTFLNKQSTDITINFLQAEKIPGYKTNSSGDFILGQVKLDGDALCTNISVDQKVFEELRKNLMEYADIEGIHIIVTLGIESSASEWPPGDSLNLLKLDYAMKGDGQ